jgi:hypothetical protein
VQIPSIFSLQALRSRARGCLLPAAQAYGGRIIRLLSNNLLGICPVSSGRVRSYVQIICAMRPFSCDTRRMDLISTSSGSALSGQPSADRASVDGRFVGAPAPKRERRRLLTKIDGRLPLGKRIKRLVSLFEAAFPAEALGPLKREQIATAAQLQGMAEEERGKWMRGEARCDLDELIRLERRAVAAVKALGIEETRDRQVTLADYLAARAGNDGEET